MDLFRIVLPFIGVGLVYFLIISFLKKKFNISYLKGMWFPLILALVLFGFAMYAQINPQPGSWNDLVFAALTSVSLVTLATYLIAWAITALVQKKK
jgi:hypothetical protein